MFVYKYLHLDITTKLLTLVPKKQLNLLVTPPLNIAGRQAVSSLLVSRLNQICKFSVNYITSRNCQLTPEEECLAVSILVLCLDAASFKNPHNNLLKGEQTIKIVQTVYFISLMAAKY